MYTSKTDAFIVGACDRAGYVPAFSRNDMRLFSFQIPQELLDAYTPNLEEAGFSVRWFSYIDDVLQEIALEHPAAYVFLRPTEQGWYGRDWFEERSAQTISPFCRTALEAAKWTVVAGKF